MKICLQSGHKNMTTGATGAAGERDWTTKIVPMIADKLKGKLEVYQTDSFADNDNTVTSTDWDMFLAIHYDADIYNDNGGFVDYPDASVDASWERSKYLAGILSDYYFATTKIPNRPSRSNANTKFYYVWSALSEKTPCVIIECGVGNRKPEDYNILRNYDFIAQTIADGILIALDLKEGAVDDSLLEIERLEKELSDMRDSRDKWRLENANNIKIITQKDEQILSMQKSNAELTAQLTLSNKTNKDMIDSLNEMANTIKIENKRLTDDCSALQTHVDSLLSAQSKNEVLLAKLQEKITKLENKLKKNILGYSTRELIVALFTKR